MRLFNGFNLDFYLDEYKFDSINSIREYFRINLIGLVEMSINSLVP